MIEVFSSVDVGVVLPLILITLNQVTAILERDEFQCQFQDEHAHSGKLSIHHIRGKADVPENLISVCNGGAHWGKLHNGATNEQKEEWARELAEIATERTIVAKAWGWKFE
ncbi:MAG: hypothetical protein UX38_C0005G0007 [Microgenomates group bacterium GW2011_GWC1_46_16]|uniref:HNH nuclease domain-containing protein n=1 Tax=Candidatus Collierbacteria bacterium RIFOXYA2_FULL_46_10 TaxID=1817726 RepID=A0A1F5F6Z0_9BACT|nr:MAG: hypothetical protein UX32_C0011G0006 [Microgenomates group bacterium GW2011_GWF1_46_12]KKU26504.1 MAG: hypothetical protein UX38_C0005G0007 [Microgenomates group bacterium GW2011_GWC1_46_16]KKU27732.1 MAG: hypothetical protein UX40_C0007G0014 [Microgenomates group bacterium GW2011_GWF2_46_18]KKU43018.1 MAG: hypothetical protein UX59_C0032G0006 [Microgenomates group bacterium GW2011_GWA1_46_7]KKU45154.1 MAG: hypothetical protein UX63_C0011G0026 [Microgenomates group bacterium GW2011_GWB1